MQSVNRKHEIFLFVRDRILSGNPPTTREVQEHFRFRAVQSARSYLEKLVTDGVLEKQPGKARGYRLAQVSNLPTKLIPLIGQVQAGDLTIAIENPEGFISVQSKRDRNNLFALRVRGESMRDAAILSGDIVIVNRQSNALSGEIIVALIEEDATVKRFKIKNNRIELHPENSEFSPIIPDAEKLQILGKVIEIRRYIDKPHEVLFHE